MTKSGLDVSKLLGLRIVADELADTSAIVGAKTGKIDRLSAKTGKIDRIGLKAGKISRIGRKESQTKVA